MEIYRQGAEMKKGAEGRFRKPRKIRRGPDSDRPRSSTPDAFVERIAEQLQSFRSVAGEFRGLRVRPIPLHFSAPTAPKREVMSPKCRFST